MDREAPASHLEYPRHARPEARGPVRKALPKSCAVQ